MRQAYALVALCDKYGDGRVEAICQSALAFDVVSVTRIASMLKSAAKPSRPEAAGQGRAAPATALRSRDRRHSKRDRARARRREADDRRTNAQSRARRRAQAPSSRAHCVERCPSGSSSPTSRRCRSTISCSCSSPTRSHAATTPPRTTAQREAGLDPSMRLEQWDKTSKVNFDKRMLSELVSLRFLEAHRHVCRSRPRRRRKDVRRDSARPHRLPTRLQRAVRACGRDASHASTESLRQLARRRDGLAHLRRSLSSSTTSPSSR